MSVIAGSRFQYVPGDDSLEERLVDTLHQVEDGRAFLASGLWANESGVRLGLTPDEAIEPLRANLEQIFAERRKRKGDRAKGK